MRTYFKLYIAALLCIAAFPLFAEKARAEHIPEDNSAAVILSYQRIGEDRHPETNIREPQFTAQITELIEGDYNIAPLPEIVDAFRNGSALSPRTIAVTFDGGYRSAFEAGIPVLLENDIPFTVFVSPSTLGATDQYMTESELKKLAKNSLVTVGLHSDRYMHLVGAPENEIRRQVNNALAWYRETFSAEPELFAYPFGEYSSAYRGIIDTSGFKAAFGQQSGAAYAGADRLALPRFVLTESYADLNRFRLVTNALPLPVTDVVPEDPYLEKTDPVIGFTLDADLGDTSPLSCFISGQSDPANLIALGANRVEIRLKTAFYDDRYRVNCTLPESFSVNGEDIVRWRWFGMLLTVAKDRADIGQ